MCEARISLPASSARQRAATSIWPGWPRTAWMRASNGVPLPSAASTDKRAGDQRRGEHVLGREQAGERQRGRTCVPLSSARPSLAAEHDRRQPGAPERLDRRHRAAGRRRASPTPISTPARWASGARSPEAPTEPLAGTHGQHVGIEQRQQRLDHAPAARRSSRAPGAMTSGPAPAAPPGRRAAAPDAGAVRQHQAALQLRQLVVGDARAARACRSRC